MTSCNFDRHARYRAAMTLDRCIAVACVTALSSGCGAPIEDTSGTEPASTTSSSTTTTSETPTSTGDAGTSTGTTAAADTTGEDSGTTEEPPPDPPAAYEEWLKVEVPGTVCGNGSQYKFFVNYKEGAKDLLIMLEPGGACWDFDGCSGKSDLGAAHPDGIPDNLMNDAGQSANISPLIRRDDPRPDQRL
jgi:hypothetical protein